MGELSGLQIFKHLPGAKKTDNSNCKRCGFPTCMAFALKLAKGNAEIEKCPFVPDELKDIFSHSMKKAQNEIIVNDIKIGGETVLYRHDKTFVNPTAITVLVDCAEKGWQEKIKRIKDFQVKRINDVFKIDFIILKNQVEMVENAISIEEFEKLPLIKINGADFTETSKMLIDIRKRAILEKDETCSNPTCVFMPHCDNLFNLTARASFYICKYANMLVFEDFDEAMMVTLLTLRQNIFTDPQKPLKVEPKVYSFNGAEEDKNSLIFLTTNFALTYFAVANELEALSRPSYLIVTPSDGMSVLTAWSAEKFTAKIFANAVKKADLSDKVKNKKIIIPGLLEHMKDELQEVLPEFEIRVGTIDAYLISDYVKGLEY